MDIEDLAPRPGSPLDELVKEDLASASLEELADRVTSLEGEIARVQALIASKKDSQQAAEAFFKT